MIRFPFRRGRAGSRSRPGLRDRDLRAFEVGVGEQLLGTDPDNLRVVPPHPGRGDRVLEGADQLRAVRGLGDERRRVRPKLGGVAAGPEVRPGPLVPEPDPERDRGAAVEQWAAAADLVEPVDRGDPDGVPPRLHVAGLRHHHPVPDVPLRALRGGPALYDEVELGHDSWPSAWSGTGWMSGSWA